MRLYFEPAADGFPGQRARPRPVDEEGRAGWRRGRLMRHAPSERIVGHRKRASKRKAFVRTGSSPVPTPKRKSVLERGRIFAPIIHYPFFHHSLFIK